MFQISMISGEPVWDSLPAAKITNYPLEKADYKPFAQARVCISRDDLYLQMLSFEVEPSEKSVLAAAFAMFPQQSDRRYFWLSTNRAGNLNCRFINEQDGTSDDVSRRVAARVFSGSDLQGIYWCAAFTLPLSVVEKYYGEEALRCGSTMRGNFYKLCDDAARPHYGSYYPVDFTAANPLGSAYFGDFQLVAY